MNHSGLVDLVHITNPEDIGSGLPPSTSEDAGKVLKVDAQGTPGWGEDAMATVDQNYDSTSTHAQSGIAVAQALSDVKEVPAVGSSDDNKVLKATYSGGVGSYSWETAPASVTVDQSYDASSANPQSGTAVAGALQTVNQVPASAAADENKVLTVNAQGTPAWSDTQLPEEKSLASTNNTISITEGATTVSIDVANPLPASTSADEDKVLTVNAQGAAEWATAQSGPSYTAGDGLTLSNGEFDVNVGDGLTLGSVRTETSTGSQNIPHDMDFGSTYGYSYVLQLNQMMADAIENGVLKVTLDSNTDVNSAYPQVAVYPTIQYGSAYVPGYDSCMTFGTGAVFGPGSVIELSLSNRNQTYGTLDIATIKANPTSCRLIFTQWYSSTELGTFTSVTPSSVTSINTAYATYSEVPNHLCVSNPIPAYNTTTDAGKVLAVGATGIGWINSVPIEVVASMPASPTAGVLYIVTGA